MSQGARRGDRRRRPRREQFEEETRARGTGGRPTGVRPPFKSPRRLQFLHSKGHGHFPKILQQKSQRVLSSTDAKAWNFSMLPLISASGLVFRFSSFVGMA